MVGLVIVLASINLYVSSLSFFLLLLYCTISLFLSLLLNQNQQRQNCGEAARQYLKKRDNQASILISRMVKYLEDYEHRLEGIESFVYMHCVGIQLEKHCSRARSKALSGKADQSKFVQLREVCMANHFC